MLYMKRNNHKDLFHCTYSQMASALVTAEFALSNHPLYFPTICWTLNNGACDFGLRESHVQLWKQDFVRKRKIRKKKLNDMSSEESASAFVEHDSARNQGDTPVSPFKTMHSVIDFRIDHKEEQIQVEDIM